jgi:predicted dehydrogenase
MEFGLEAGRRIRAGFIGAGGHTFRNLYPAFQYALVELVALADHHPEKAAAYARRWAGGSGCDCATCAYTLMSD